MALVAHDSDLWQLCKELESLGGGIDTRLEKVSVLSLTKDDDYNPPYLRHDSDRVTPLTVEDISTFLHSVAKFAQQGFNSTLVTSGPTGSGKSTFLYSTSFWQVLLSELQGSDFDEIHFEAYEMQQNEQLRSLLQLSQLKPNKKGTPLKLSCAHDIHD